MRVVADRMGGGVPGVGHLLRIGVRLTGRQGQFVSGAVCVAEPHGFFPRCGLVYEGDVRAVAQGLGDADHVVVRIDQRARIAVAVLSRSAEVVARGAGRTGI